MIVLPLIFTTFNQAMADDLNTMVGHAWKRASAYQVQAKEVEKLVQENISSLSPIENKESGSNGISVDHLLSQYKEKFLKSQINPNLLIFISFSLKEQNIREYAEEARRRGAILVLRGMYEGSLRKTVEKLYTLNKEGIAAVIDPKSFKQYQVNQVPSIVLTKGNSCESCTPIFDKVSGNISLEYALQLFAQKGDTKAIAAKLLKEGA
jgi:conjugal transfer pilus assembly protein TrbC